MRARSLVSLVLLSWTLPLSAQSHFPSDDSIRAMVRRHVDIGGRVGVVVGLLDADGSRRVVAVSDAPYDGRTLFEIGSITKVFTGILLADAVQRGEARLDQPLAELLPDSVTVPARGGREITLLNLATHTSGLPRMPSNFSPANWQNPYTDYTVAQMYAFLRGHTLGRDIGRDPVYSNIGAAILGHALARRAGMSYADLVRARILEPLGMHNTMIAVPDSLRGQFAPGHNASGDSVSQWDLSDAFAGAGALRSGAEDMLTFLAANVAPGDSTTLSRAMRVAATRHPAGFASGGLHWGITRTTPGTTIVGHGGGTGGFATWAGFDPDARRAVVVLSNVIDNDVYRVGPHLLEPRTPLSLAPLARGFRWLAYALAALLVAGVGVAWRRAGATALRTALVAAATAAGVALWMALTHGLAQLGLLRFDTTPPTITVLFVVLLVLAVALGASRMGARLAAGLPLAVLVGVHAFRLPLELLMHRAYEWGLMPEQMSYTGMNFDILTGVSAIGVALLVTFGRAGPRTVRVWNWVGVLLLVNVLVISVLSAPGPLRLLRTSPPNTWIATAPFVWLPTVMVAFAIVGHIVVFRRLRAMRTAGGTA